PTYVHSMVVASLARYFCLRMAQTVPELLAGTFGVEDVEGRLEFLSEQTYRGGLYHDLGKCMLLNYISLYGRKLLDEEFTCIKLHPLFGCGLLTSLGMEEISNIAYYHHRSFDGVGGYPNSQADCPVSVQRIVDIITVVDALDAGTDNVGRSYAAAKTYEQLVEELRAGRGTRYAPEVVALLDDPDFYQGVKQCLADSRHRAYLDAYLGER
ncbi:MAG: HD domain-containing protein, partial [Acetatifactor sp.]|nr:HD domain-containing protein [Acetatifactor sp.]